MKSEFPKASRLEKPVRITEQVWPEGTMPVVSICCLTYNHESFIRDAIESFLMQETTFPVEILVHDDASTDKTAAIIREYVVRYPNLIRPIFQAQNQYSVTGDFFAPVLAQACAGYIAFCEGDDYWTDPEKLELQHALMEAEPNAAGCFHLMEMRFEDGSASQIYPPKERHHDRIFEDIAFSYHLSTGSIFYRKTLYAQRPAWARGLYMGDVPLIAELCLKGSFRFIDRVMGVYRQHEGGAWAGLDYRRKFRVSFDLCNAVLCHFTDFDLPKVERQKKHFARLMFIESMGAGDMKAARYYLWHYIKTPPLRWRLPPNQKKAAIRCLLPWFTKKVAKLSA
jgi:glycosyltransferase involved in cell wall biosynthesis